MPYFTDEQLKEIANYLYGKGCDYKKDTFIAPETEDEWKALAFPIIDNRDPLNPKNVNAALSTLFRYYGGDVSVLKDAFQRLSEQKTLDYNSLTSQKEANYSQLATQKESDLNKKISDANTTIDSKVKAASDSASAAAASESAAGNSAAAAASSQQAAKASEDETSRLHEETAGFNQNVENINANIEAILAMVQGQSFIIGDGSSTSFDIQHNYTTGLFGVQVWSLAADGALPLGSATQKDGGVLHIEFDTPPAQSSVNVYLYGVLNVVNMG